MLILDVGEESVLEAKGRHDPCVVPRAVPIVEAMAALVIMDALMIQSSRIACANRLPSLANDDQPGIRMLTGGASGKPVTPN